MSLPLYVAWKMLQAPAFTGVPTSWWQATSLCALAGPGDAAIVLGLWAVGSWVMHAPSWFDAPRPGPYFGLVLGGIAVNTLVERLAVSASI